MPITKSLLLKLGGNCNLGCSHCHCENHSYKFNPDILKWIKSQKFKKIVFGGGEPLLYWDLICGISGTLGNTFKYKFVTNGTLLSQNIITYINLNDFEVVVSFDGWKGNRDSTIPVKWDLVKQIKNLGFCSCYFKNNDIFSINNDLTELEFNLFSTTHKFANHSCVFPHQTTYNPNLEISTEDVSTYVKQYKEKLAEAISEYKFGLKLQNSHILYQALKDWYIPKNFSFGYKCFNDWHQNLTIDGRFLLCPYGHEYIGDIYTGIDKEKIKQYIPDRCKACKYWEICRNTCIANITEHECIIFKEMHEFLKSCFKKLNIEEQIKQDYENTLVI